jgi:hypothetical protein
VPILYSVFSTLIFSNIMYPMNLIRAPNYGEVEELFWMGLVVCEEDQPRFTTFKQRGAFRWFRSPNIVPIEKYRRPSPLDGDRRAA